jgi:DNA-binding NarL/FixJ family response regulator
MIGLWDSFSKREKLVATMLIKGIQRKDVCKHLGVPLPTMRAALTRMYRKAGIPTRGPFVHHVRLVYLLWMEGECPIL